MGSVLAAVLSLALALAAMALADSHHDVLQTKAEWPERTEAVQNVGGLFMEWEYLAGSATVGQRLQSDAPYVTYFPNPSDDAVTFMAQRICWCRVSGIRVSIYSMSGALVRVSESDRALVEVDLTEDPATANGSYIARPELKIDGAWVPMATSLLTILR